MLINVLLDQFLNIKVSQGSVATRLRCDGIFNGRFITQSLLSPIVKNSENRHLPKLWAIKYRGVFMKHGVYINLTRLPLLLFKIQSSGSWACGIAWSWFKITRCRKLRSPTIGRHRNCCVVACCVCCPQLQQQPQQAAASQCVAVTHDDSTGALCHSVTIANVVSTDGLIVITGNIAYTPLGCFCIWRRVQSTRREPPLLALTADMQITQQAY